MFALYDLGTRTRTSNELVVPALSCLIFNFIDFCVLRLSKYDTWRICFLSVVVGCGSDTRIYRYRLGRQLLALSL